jgi:hypothetical protein
VSAVYILRIESNYGHRIFAKVEIHRQISKRLVAHHFSDEGGTNKRLVSISLGPEFG